MRRLLRLVGAALVLAGIALLGYVGLTYARQTTATVPHWSTVEKKRAAEIAHQFAGRQNVRVPVGVPAAQLPTPGSEPAERMIIPKIALDAGVVQTAPVNGVWDVVDWAVGHLSTTPNPGGRGNAAYSAHDDIKGEVFKRVGELKPGDEILLRTRHSLYTYIVTNQVTVDPSNVSVLAPTPKSTVTLVSCAPYWVDTQRLIIQGVLKSVKAA